MDALSPISTGATATPSPADATRNAPATPVSFAAVLERQIAEARSRVDGVRAEIASLRNGGGIGSGIDAGLRTSNVAGTPRATSVADVAARLQSISTGDEADPYGWRQMARSAGEEIVGAGYGPLFERQIQQESGFAPDVVFGLRKSSAGAEGIAQLMPQYYPNVDRTDPRASLLAGARSMDHYLSAWDGDVRKALASYNAGLGKVRQLVSAHGDRWEAALPLETRRYLSAIVGDARPLFSRPSGAAAAFGGRGPAGVLTMPVDRTGSRVVDEGLELTAEAGSAVRAPADGTVHVTRGDAGTTLSIDHGNGWQSRLTGIDGDLPADGSSVRRGTPLGVVDGSGRLVLGLALDGRAVPPLRYLIG